MNQGVNSQQLWDEYALVQGKLDKIGEFRFHVKGWATTLVSAVVAAAASATVPRAAVLLGIPVVVLFFYFERYHAVWQRAYVRRAHELERLLSQLGSRASLVHTIVVAHAEQRRKRFGKLMLRAHDLFYLGLCLFLLLAYCVVGSSPTPWPTASTAPAATPRSSQRDATTNPTPSAAAPLPSREASPSEPSKSLDVQKAPQPVDSRE